MKKYLLLAGLIGLLFIATACGKQEVQAREIDEGNDKCAQCNMMVANNRYATQIVLENGQSLMFDDIGCMYKWVEENPNEQVAAEFVRDYNTKDWITVADATYVYEKNIKTPMAYNVVSFDSQAKAEEFADKQNGTVLSSEELNDHKWEVNEEMKMQIMEENKSKMNMDSMEGSDSMEMDSTESSEGMDMDNSESSDNMDSSESMNMN